MKRIDPGTIENLSIIGLITLRLYYDSQYSQFNFVGLSSKEYCHIMADLDREINKRIKQLLVDE